MNKALILAAALAYAPSAAASDDALRPAPDYFVDAVVASTTAQALALACATISVNPVALQAVTTDILQRLEADGFDVSRSEAGMLPSTEAFDARQQEFLTKHGLSDTATPDAACAAAEAEMAEGSAIGTLLLTVGPE